MCRRLVVLAFLAACGGDDGSSTPAGHWQMLTPTKQTSSLLAAWSNGMDNVWIVGGREGNAAGAPVIWHYDGMAWMKMDHGQNTTDFWQVFGFDDAVFIGGSDGKIFRYRNNAFELMTTPAKPGIIVFGLWGTSSSDVWATGGKFASDAFVWHFDGTTWSEVPGVPTDITGAVWKVTGRSKDDVWMSASRNYVLHWNGTALSAEKIGLEDAQEKTLFSIGCSKTRCTTAGSNQSNGVLYDNAGAAWTSGFDNGGPVWRGVTPVGEHQYVVGQFGAVVRYDGKAWVADSHMLTTETLHATWSDDKGNMFAVGGKFDRPITIDGVILFKGADDLPALP